MNEHDKVGMRVILASDGLWDAVPYKVSLASVRKKSSQAACQSLVKMAAKAAGKERDDICIVVVDVGRDSPFQNLDLSKNASPAEKQRRLTLSSTAMFTPVLWNPLLKCTPEFLPVSLATTETDENRILPELKLESSVENRRAAQESCSYESQELERVLKLSLEAEDNQGWEMVPVRTKSRNNRKENNENQPHRPDKSKKSVDPEKLPVKEKNSEVDMRSKQMKKKDKKLKTDRRKRRPQKGKDRLDPTVRKSKNIETAETVQNKVQSKKFTLKKVQKGNTRKDNVGTKAPSELIRSSTDTKIKTPAEFNGVKAQVIASGEETIIASPAEKRNRRRNRGNNKRRGGARRSNSSRVNNNGKSKGIAGEEKTGNGNGSTMSEGNQANGRKMHNTRRPGPGSRRRHRGKNSQKQDGGSETSQT
mmetsp:Transcript_15848/g.19238  ORF Transcript_15848/g.19238 Transcript_15848/m.19238 type:complete len:420 (-) Transcript_15848:65-1324(-)